MPSQTPDEDHYVKIFIVIVVLGFLGVLLGMGIRSLFA